MSCDCETWIQATGIPEKIIILKCNRCLTEYTLYPNGQITFEQPAICLRTEAQKS